MNAATAPPAPAAPVSSDYDSPFRGTGSYGPEDAVVFFGRDRECEQIVQMVLGCRVSYLYAKSGVGKSSLLAARVHAGLERRGWMPVEIRLGDDPLANACRALRQQALPQPALEAACAQELTQALGAELPVRELAEACDARMRKHPRDRVLLRRRALPSEPELRLPWLARVARGGLDATEYLEALDRLAAHGPASWPIDPGLALGDLCDRLCDPLLHATSRERMAELEALGDVLPALLAALDQGGPPLALVFDQFEELFTQFGDEGSMLTGADPLLQRHDWMLRHRLIDALEQVFGAAAPLGSQRLLFSLREDFVAELEELRGVAPLAESNTFRLSMLTTQYAREAIEEPMLRYNMAVDDDCVRQVVADLTREQRYVYPADLQVVSERLWSEARQRSLPCVSRTLYLDELGGHARILGEFFGRVLDRLTPLEQVEALDLLAPLVTGSFKRNIVEREQLLSASFRDAELRGTVLGFLEREHILRIERKHKGDFIEISHEFLIASIEREREVRLQEEDRATLRAIRQLRDRLAIEEDGGQPAVLDALTFADVDAVKHRLVWSMPARLLMLRSALQLEVPAGQTAQHRQCLVNWVKQLGGEAEPPWTQLVQRLRESQRTRQPLGRLDWQQLRDRLGALPEALRNGPGVLRSALRWCEPAHAVLLSELVRARQTGGEQG